MRKILSVICIVLLTVGIAFSQSTETKTPATGTTHTNVAKPKTTTTSTTGNSNGSTATKGNSSTSTSQSTSETGTTTSSSTGTRVATDNPSNDTIVTTTAKSSNFTLDHFIIGGGISAGALISTDIISTGGLLNAEFEVMVQFKHHRMGIGGDKTLMLNLRNLGTVIGTLGKSNCNLNKVYFTYEWTLFKRSPINFTAGLKLGYFDVGKSEYRTEQESQGNKATKSPFFAAAGIAFEVGHPRFLLYVKPEIGFHSYDTGSWRKDLYVMATVGFRWKTKRLDKYESLNTTTETGKKYE